MARLTGKAIMAVVLVAALSAAGSLWAAEAPASHTEVKRTKSKGPKHPSLEFLRANRVFIRAQLDQLRLLTTLESEGQAQLLDERMLRLQELAAEIRAARDTVAVESANTARQELLASVESLGDLDRQLAQMEQLAAAQRGRLQELEADFLGRQETALVILVQGLPDTAAPGGITLREDNEVVRVPLSAQQQQSLRQGGVAQIYHRFVEPRDHVYLVGFQGQDWAAAPPVELAVNALRDRITFVQLDLTGLDASHVDSGLTTRVWVR